MHRAFTATELAALQSLVAQNGLSAAARRLGYGYLRVRRALLAAGFEVRRGRRPRSAQPRRERDIGALRASGATLSEIATRYGVSPQRISQILHRSEARHSQGAAPVSSAAERPVAPTPNTASRGGTLPSTVATT